MTNEQGKPDAPSAQQSSRLSESANAPSLSGTVISISDTLLERLVERPRSYLLAHIGPLLPQHSRLADAVTPALEAELKMWNDSYEALIAALGLKLRPEWTAKRAALVLQAMLDGMVLRWRIQHEEYKTSRWEDASVMADGVIAFMLGVFDWERSGDAGRVALDKLVARRGGL